MTLTPNAPEPSVHGQNGMRYNPLGPAMRREFGESVWKVSVDAGFSCPNVDGTVGTGGCIFCNTHSFAPGRRLAVRENRTIPIAEQIDEGIRQLQRRYAAKKFIAYFQPSTNTYAAPDRLEAVYREAMEHPNVVGLAIGTRPDALPDAVLDLLADLSRKAWVQLEIGLQSIHPRSLAFLNRGHDFTSFGDAFHRARIRRLRLGVHLILGIPGENRDDILATADEIGRLQPETIKLHNLYVVRNTRLAEIWEQGEIRLPSLEEYASMVVDFLERQSPETVIDRISGEASSEYLLAPDWALVKHAARNAVDREFLLRNSCQGSLRSLR